MERGSTETFWSRRAPSRPRFIPPGRWRSSRSPCTTPSTGSWAVGSRSWSTSVVPARLGRCGRGRRRSHRTRRAAPQPAAGDRRVLPDSIDPTRLRRGRSSRASATVTLWQMPSWPRAQMTARLPLRRCSPRAWSRRVPVDPTDLRAGGVHADGARHSVRAAEREPVPPAPAARADQPTVRRRTSTRSTRWESSTARRGRLTETAIAKFWGAAPVWVVWNQSPIRPASASETLSSRTPGCSRVLDTTLADSAIALYDAKYAYHRWRPITAITASDEGNPNTAGRSQLGAVAKHGQRPQLSRSPCRVQPGGRDGARRTTSAPTCSRSR